MDRKNYFQLLDSDPNHKKARPSFKVPLGRPTMDENTDRGASSPANPALTIPEPLSFIKLFKKQQKKNDIVSVYTYNDRV